MKRCSFAAFIALLASTLHAAEQPAVRGEIWFGEYHQTIPTPESVIGHPLGARLTPSADIRRYFEALQQSAPQRIVLGEYARSWQGRSLIWAAISSPENIARLDRIKETARALPIHGARRPPKRDG